MTIFDWVIIAVFIVSMLIGLMRGFIREALSIASWIIAAWLAFTFCNQAGDFIANYFPIPAEAFRIVVGFVAVFISTLFVFSVLGFLLGKLFSHGAIKGTDQVLGLGFGALRAIAVVAVIMVLARGMGMDSSDWWKDSKYVHHFMPAANFLESVLPEKLQSSVDDQRSGQSLDVNLNEPIAN